jgi:hypothetical protein
VIRRRLIRYGVYPVAGERVWGATARMLGQLGALLAGEPTESAADIAAGPPAAAPAAATPTPTVSPPSHLRRPTGNRSVSRGPRSRPRPRSTARVRDARGRGRRQGSSAWPAGLRGIGRGLTTTRAASTGLDFPAGESAELTLLAVAPEVRGQRNRPEADQRQRRRPPRPRAGRPPARPGPSPIRRSTPRRSPPGRSSVPTASTTWRRSPRPGARRGSPGAISAPAVKTLTHVRVALDIVS